MVFSKKFFSGGLSNRLGSLFGGRQSLPTNSLKDPFKSPGNVAQHNADKQILQYPLDIGGSPNQGHFIMFYINTQDAGTLKYNGDAKRGGRKIASAENREQVSSQSLLQRYQAGQISRDEFLRGASNVETGNLRNNPNASANEVFTFKRAPTTRTNQLIALYMPSTVEVTYASQYEDKDITVTGKAVTQVIDAPRDQKGKAIGEGVTEAGTEAARTSMDAIAGGTRAIEFARAGKVTMDRMELIFSGVAKREFNYNFKFLPKSLQEAKVVREIINTFKFHMLPELMGDPGTSRDFVTPDTFDIEYHWVGSGEHNSYLNKVSTCVLQNFNVKYGGGRYSTHVADETNNTPPVESEISLSFKELEIITKTRASEGF